MSTYEDLLELAGNELEVHTDFVNPMRDKRTNQGLLGQDMIRTGTRFYIRKTEREIKAQGEDPITIRYLQITHNGHQMFLGASSHFSYRKKLVALCKQLLVCATPKKKLLGTLVHDQTSFTISEFGPAILAVMMRHGMVGETDVLAAAQVANKMEEEPYLALLKEYGFDGHSS